MLEFGNQFKNNHITHIYFSHGTFVGNDPFGLVRALEIPFPIATRKAVHYLKHKNFHQSNKILKDQANYLPSYVKLFETAIGNEIPCHNFIWSSGNYHAARVSGAFKLLNQIVFDMKSTKVKQPHRILLIGHSHAGQVFALLSNLIEYTALGKTLAEVSSQHGFCDKTKLHALIDQVAKLKLDYALFGTPYIYPWPKRSARNLINIINHRNHPYLAGRRRGILFTTDGDYVQQWGITGSDFKAMTSQERKFNKDLDKILGDGTNRTTWQEQTRSRLRVPPFGKTYLIDYKDNSHLVPNCFNTIFGHGIYTRFQTMHFNTRIICEALYT
ncbi:MAG: hypothetical protein R3B45_04165 [Bdellovibrionota bacterium]